MKYQCVTVEGEITIKDIMSLKEMQEFVGGFVQQVRTFFVNEEGLVRKLPRNRIYTQFVGNVIALIED